MTARDAILNAVRTALPVSVSLPDVQAMQRTFPRNGEDLALRMKRVATAGGTSVVEAARTDIARVVRETYPNAKRVVSLVDAEPDAGAMVDPHTLEDVDVFVCEGALGVAEDGSVWLPVTGKSQRAALFISTHVVLVLDQTKIVENLHDAYSHIDISSNAFGVFIAGPSKTADIEQSLVIGAHGPKSLTLVLLDDGNAAEYS